MERSVKDDKALEKPCLGSSTPPHWNRRQSRWLEMEFRRQKSPPCATTENIEEFLLFDLVCGKFWAAAIWLAKLKGIAKAHWMLLSKSPKPTLPGGPQWPWLCTMKGIESQEELSPLVVLNQWMKVCWPIPEGVASWKMLLLQMKTSWDFVGILMGKRIWLDSWILMQEGLLCQVANARITLVTWNWFRRKNLTRCYQNFSNDYIHPSVSPRRSPTCLKT